MPATTLQQTTRRIAERLPLPAYVTYLSSLITRLDDDLDRLTLGAREDSELHGRARATVYDELHAVRMRIVESLGMIQLIAHPRLKFPLGRVVVTQGVRALHEDAYERAVQDLAYQRHGRGLYGLIPNPDKMRNEIAARNGQRVVSRYDFFGAEVIVITDGDRSVTTVMLDTES